MVTREAGPVKGGTTTIAFIQDPSGYLWELIGRDTSEPIREPLAQVMLRVGDLERSIKFYTEALGMRLLRTRENEQYKYTLAFLGYGDEVSGHYDLICNHSDVKNEAPLFQNWWGLDCS